MNRGGQEAWTLIARTMRSSSFARIYVEGDIDMARLEAMRRAGRDGDNRRVSGHDLVFFSGAAAKLPLSLRHILGPAHSLTPSTRKGSAYASRATVATAPTR
jgi:hypothetical protein